VPKVSAGGGVRGYPGAMPAGDRGRHLGPAAGTISGAHGATRRRAWACGGQRFHLVGCGFFITLLMTQLPDRPAGASLPYFLRICGATSDSSDRF
jgi:hypothetical protein